MEVSIKRINERAIKPAFLSTNGTVFDSKAEAFIESMRSAADMIYNHDDSAQLPHVTIEQLLEFSFENPELIQVLLQFALGSEVTTSPPGE